MDCGKAAITLAGVNACECYAVASRTQEKADAFAAKWGIVHAYGQYSDLIADKLICEGNDGDILCNLQL